MIRMLLLLLALPAPRWPRRTMAGAPTTASGS